MQTFVPYPSFRESARCLDYRRLGKERIEAKQILTTLLGYSTGWINHPVMRMWEGYEIALAEYGEEICYEWKKRGYIDNIGKEIELLRPEGELILPWWFGQLMVLFKCKEFGND